MARGWKPWTTGVAAALVAGCPTASQRGEVDPVSGESSPAPSSSAGGTSDAWDESASTSGSAKLDVGPSPDLGRTFNRGCEKVDFLFVVDNSGSMASHQQSLIENVPDFIAGIQATLSYVEEIHVGVTTTDSYGANIPGCDALGGLVVRTGGRSSSAEDCGPYAEGYSFMTEADNLVWTFACAAQVGTRGSNDERPMNALEAVVRGDHGGPGQCNEGFIREDALLVVVVITDEGDGPGSANKNDAGSDGDPSTWFGTVVDAKGGHADNTAVLTLTYVNGGPCPPPEASGDPRGIQTFAEMFGDNGFLGCIDNDYATIFAEATGVIANACEDFIQPG